MPTTRSSRRHKLFIGALLGGIIGVISAQASFAQGTPSDEPAVEERYLDKTAVDFTDVHVEGTIIKPDGVYTHARKQTRFRNLIEMRASFTPELERSQPKL